MTRTLQRAAAAALLVLASSGCAATDTQGDAPDGAAAGIAHDVYFQLNDDAVGRADELVEACMTLRDIPGVVHVTAGRRDESRTRPVNALYYHVGLHVEFTDAAAYDAYDPHPIHQALVAEFAPTFRSVLVYDTTLSR